MIDDVASACSTTGIEIEKGSDYILSLPANNSIMISSDANYFSVDVNKPCEVALEMDTGLTVKGEDFDYTLYAAIGENNDLVKVSGSAEKDVVLSKTGNAVSVDSDDNAYNDMSRLVHTTKKQFFGLPRPR